MASRGEQDVLGSGEMASKGKVELETAGSLITLELKSRSQSRSSSEENQLYSERGLAISHALQGPLLLEGNQGDLWTLLNFQCTDGG